MNSAPRKPSNEIAEVRAGVHRSSRRPSVLLFPAAWLSARAASRPALVAALHGRDAAGLPKRCKPHGLRKAACRRLAEAGCSANEIMAISGHATLKELIRYTAAADQARLARNALAKEVIR